MSFPRYPAYKDSGVEWLGEVPEHWEVLPLKREFAVVGGSTPKSDMQTYWDGDIQWITPADLSRLQSFEITESIRTITAEGLNSCGATMVPIGSVVVSTRAPIGSLGIAAIDLCTNQGCKALVPINQISSKFTAYFLGIATEALNVRGRGATFLEISGDELGAFKATLPPCQEQLQIATFLDRETAKIDALIAEQQRLIDLLQEKRQSVISHAVTKGLNPDAPMKDSGVEWLGEVPEHWIITRLGRISTSRCDGPFGSGLKSEHYVQSGVLVVRLQNIKSSGYDSAVSAFIDNRYYSEHLGDHDVEPGDLLIAGLGDDNNYVGRACVAPDDMGSAMVKADCFRFRLASEIAAPGFIASSLNASATFHAGTLSSGSTRSRIPLSVMATREIALPPLEEQIQIISSIKSKLSEIDQLQGEAEAATVLLQERRSALISAAVIGQIDVRGLVPEASAA